MKHSFWFLGVNSKMLTRWTVFPFLFDWVLFLCVIQMNLVLVFGDFLKVDITLGVERLVIVPLSFFFHSNSIAFSPSSFSLLLRVHSFLF